MIYWQRLFEKHWKMIPIRVYAEGAVVGVWGKTLLRFVISIFLLHVLVFWHFQVYKSNPEVAMEWYNCQYVFLFFMELDDLKEWKLCLYIFRIPHNISCKMKETKKNSKIICLLSPSLITLKKYERTSKN